MTRFLGSYVRTRARARKFGSFLRRTATSVYHGNIFLPSDNVSYIGAYSSSGLSRNTAVRLRQIIGESIEAEEGACRPLQLLLIYNNAIGTNSSASPPTGVRQSFNERIPHAVTVTSPTIFFCPSNPFFTLEHAFQLTARLGLHHSSRQ